MPFVHIPQYKEKEFVDQSVVWRCSVEGFVWIIRRIDAVGALAFPEVEQTTCMRAGYVSRREKIQDITLKYSRKEIWPL